jgi:molybdopterin molybdotransferase
MISVAEARGRIISSLRPSGTEVMALAQAHGRVLAAPVLARLSQPPADVSAMDGYALRAEDGISGAKLRVIGEAPAGHAFTGRVGAGEAVRLFTGSFVPEGADTILPQECAAAVGGTLTVGEGCVAGRHIRRRGQDFLAGSELIQAGRRLTARDVGLAAAGNHPWLSVYRRPRIAVLVTGDEISLPGEEIGSSGIVNSNSSMLAAFILAHGGEPLILPIARDDIEAIAAGAEAARGVDMLVTTGGASVGAHDLVQAGLKAHGFVLDFWKIAMRPGKPLFFGRMGEVPVLGLPGNPVSAFVCAELFLKPAMAVISGLSAATPALSNVRLGVALKSNDAREDYLRAKLDWRDNGWVATPLPVQDSGMLWALARADVLIRRPSYQEALPEGENVEVLRIDDL